MGDGDVRIGDGCDGDRTHGGFGGGGCLACERRVQGGVNHTARHRGPFAEASYVSGAADGCTDVRGRGTVLLENVDTWMGRDDPLSVAPEIAQTLPDGYDWAGQVVGPTEVGVAVARRRVWLLGRRLER